MSYQHRYIEYSRDHDKTPEAMSVVDKERWPGACMCGFMCWISERWTEFSKIFKRDRHSHSLQDHADFDVWLTTRNKPLTPIEEQMDLFMETDSA